MLSTINNVSSGSIDYYMYPVVANLRTQDTGWQYKSVIQSSPFSSGPWPWYIFSETTYYPSSFSWSNEFQRVRDTVSTLESHAAYNRVLGWHFGDELFGGEGASHTTGFRTFLKSQITRFRQEVEYEDTTRPIHCGFRCIENYFPGTYTGEEEALLPSTAFSSDLEDIDYIWDSAVYVSDVVNIHGGNWSFPVLAVESAMRNVLDNGYADSYVRFNGCRHLVNFGSSDSPQNFTTENSIANNYPYLDELRFLAYSSWICGGQGMMWFRYDHPDARLWFGDMNDGSSDGDQICAFITQEASIMSDWLMDEPVTNINCYLTDSQNKTDKTRFTLKRHQDGTDGRYLLIFCNFNNDNLNHDTTIHFPDHTVGTTITKVSSNMPGSFSRPDSHTVTFSYSSGTHDVYASACFITLN